MKRRQFVLGLGAASVGSAGVVGTGAFSELTADRDVNLRIAADRNAYLRLEDTSAVTEETVDRNILKIDLTEINTFQQVDGEGFNKRSIYELDNVKAGENRRRSGSIFAVRNQSDRRIEFAGETVDDEGPTIELYDVTDDSRTAIDEDNPYELAVGASVGIGLRIIVPAGADVRTYSQMLRINAEDAGA